MREARRFTGGIVLLIAALGAGSHAAAQDPGPRQILEESVKRYQAASLEYAGEVITVSRNGRERRKTWRSYRDGYGSAANRLIRFLSPPEVRDVGFLTKGRAGSVPEQWIYLPSMRRERRIAPQDRDTPFVGTDFSFEDLEEIDPDRYDVTRRPDQTIDGQSCYVIHLRPTQASTYDYQVLTIRKDTLALLIMEAYARGVAGPVKRLTLSDYRQIQERWIAMRLEMSDLRRGTRTIVLMSDVSFDRPQPPERFTVQNLTRGGTD
jgi:outer membrane lipoprotein-sorting protein